jgi:probable rRNA maturation factor
MPLSLTVQYACKHEALPSRPQVRRWVSRALKATAPERAEVTVRFVEEEEGQALNRDFRGKDSPTNVLSFPYTPAPELAGDLVLCLPVVLREAAEQGKTSEAHFAHMVVHGMLHLQAYDHDNDDDAEIMEDEEREILGELGYEDPYSGEM